MFVKIGFFLILSFLMFPSNIFAYSAKRIPSKSIDDYTEKSNSIDLNAAYKIIETYKYLRSSNKRARKPKKISVIRRSLLFKKYFSIISSTLSVNYCKKNHHIFKTDHISDIVIREANKKCFRKFIKVINKKKSINKQELSYIKKNFEYLLNKPFDKVLASLLKEGPNKFNSQLKDFIKEKYIRREIKPSSHLVNILDIDSELTSLLQEINYYAKQDKQYIYKEINRLFKRVKESLKEENTEEARDYLNQLVEFHSKNKKIIKDYNFDKRLHYIARLTLKSPDLELQKDVFDFSKKLKEEDSFNETIFQIIFNFLNQEEPYLATKFIASKKLLSQIDDLSSKNRYWIARAFEMNNEVTEAKELYVKQIELVPFSFYSILSLERLKILNPNYGTNFLVKQSYKKKIFSPSTLGDNEFKKMDIWLKAGHYRFFNAHKNHLLGKCDSLIASSNNEELNCHEVLIRLFSNNDQFIESFKLAYKFLEEGKVELDNLLLETLFPIRYQKQIEKSGIKDKIILSLIRQESGFNRYARSPAGARGLMQLMPATARSFKRNITRRKLYNPNLNIRLGSRYLKYLLKKYKGNLTYVFSAYNAGEGNLKRWIRDGRFKGSALDNIEQIPFHETRMYVKLLYRNMFFYNLLTNQRSISSINSDDSLLNYKLKH